MITTHNPTTKKPDANGKYFINDFNSVEIQSQNVSVDKDKVSKDDGNHASKIVKNVATIDWGNDVKTTKRLKEAKILDKEIEKLAQNSNPNTGTLFAVGYKQGSAAHSDATAPIRVCNMLDTYLRYVGQPLSTKHSTINNLEGLNCSVLRFYSQPISVMKVAQDLVYFVSLHWADLEKTHNGTLDCGVGYQALEFDNGLVIMYTTE